MMDANIDGLISDSFNVPYLLLPDVIQLCSNVKVNHHGGHQSQAVFELSTGDDALTG